MTTLADIALVVAVIVTGVLFMLALSNGKLAGPDKAGAAIAYFIVTPFRWLALAVALGVAIGDGGFAWIGGSVTLQVILVYAVHLAVGVGSVVLLAAGSDSMAPRSAKIACAIVGYLVPAALIAHLGQVLHAEPGEAAGGVTRIILFVLLGLGLVSTLVAAYPVMAKASRRRAADRAARDVEAQAHYAERMAALEALDDATPLEQWLGFTDDNQPGEVQRRAIALLMARPTLHEDLTKLLAGDWLVEALRFVRWRMTTAPAPLALPVRDAVERVAALVGRRIEEGERPFDGQFELETDQATKLADRFHSVEVDFRPALIATRAALDLAPDHRFAPLQARLDAWLRRHRSK